MKLLIHDLPQEEFKDIFPSIPENIEIISNTHPIHNCIGCFGCWIKTPTKCVIKDKYGHMASLISKSDEVILISECCYGSYSPFIKNVLDRSIGFISPYFTIVNGEMHHQKRYPTSPNLSVLFYGEHITQQEKSTAEKLVKANGVNLHCPKADANFYTNKHEMKGYQL